MAPRPPLIRKSTIFLTYTVPTGPPQNFTVRINSSRSLVLNWAFPLPPDVNGIVTGYTLRVTSSIGNSSFLIGSNVANYNLTSLRPYVSYTCSIAAHTFIGQGPFSTDMTLTTPEDNPEAPPVMVTQGNVISRSVALTWVAPRSDRQNGVIRHYIIEAYKNNTGNLLSYQTASDQVNFIVSSLHPFYTYTIRIQAVTVGPGPLSLPLTVNTMEDSKIIFKSTVVLWHGKIYYQEAVFIYRKSKTILCPGALYVNYPFYRGSPSGT